MLAHASLSTAGPLIETWRRACNMSFFNLLRSLGLTRLRALAPLSGHALETGMDRQRSAREKSRGKKWQNEGWRVIRWRVQVVEVVAAFPSLISLGSSSFQSIRSNLNFPHSALSFSALTLAWSFSSVSLSAKKCFDSDLMWSSPYFLNPGFWWRV